MQKSWLNFLKFLENKLLTPTCILCYRPSLRTQDLCLACEQDLPWLPTSCPCCALPFPTSQAQARQCGACLKNPPPFKKIHALFSYEEPIINLITEYKFFKKLTIGRVLSELMLRHIATTYPQKPDVLIAMPLHPRRLRERGFNQALELAKPLARHLNIPLNTQACKRQQFNAAQTKISAVERQQNVKNAFTLQGDFTGLHVVIIDDVVTTGQTAAACSKLFVQHGAAQVDIWCCARTPFK